MKIGNNRIHHPFLLLLNLFILLPSLLGVYQQLKTVQVDRAGGYLEQGEVFYSLFLMLGGAFLMILILLAFLARTEHLKIAMLLTLTIQGALLLLAEDLEMLYWHAWDKDSPLAIFRTSGFGFSALWCLLFVGVAGIKLLSDFMRSKKGSSKQKYVPDKPL